MRAALVLAVLVLAGCTGSSSAPETTPSPTPATPAGDPSVAMKWSPTFPQEGTLATFTATADGNGHGDPTAWSWSFDGQAAPQATGPEVRHSFGASGEHKVRVEVTFADGATAASERKPFVTSRGDPVPPPNATVPDGNITYVPPTFACPAGNVTEAQATFGTSEELPQLAWAALKTGTRAAVVWQSGSATTGSVEYKVGTGPMEPSRVAETVPGMVHLFVLDGLTLGQQLCFRATEGGTTTAWHGLRLRNAMEAHEEAFGVYTMNFLVVSNEGADRTEVEPDLGEYARLLWDATDGHVRMGAILLVQDDLLHANLGYGCYFVPVPGACANVYDVVYTNDADPRGAASTYRQGIRERAAAIWMNQYHQAMPGPVSLDDGASVLVHEVGHYAFDMDDLYGDPVVPDATECDVGKWSISIMGGPRDATEFDDELHPCPGQGGGYVPSWTLMRGQFPEIPDRTEIDPGPDGDGGVAQVLVYRGR